MCQHFWCQDCCLQDALGQQPICDAIFLIPTLHRYSTHRVHLRAMPCNIILNNTFTEPFWLSILQPGFTGFIGFGSQMESASTISFHWKLWLPPGHFEPFWPLNCWVENGDLLCLGLFTPINKRALYCIYQTGAESNISGTQGIVWSTHIQEQKLLEGRNKPKEASTKNSNLS